MRHKAHVAHHVRGRIRIKVAGAKGNRPLLQEITKSVAPIAGIRSIHINPATGSIVVEYDERVHPDFHTALSDQGKDTGAYSLSAPELSEVDEIANRIEREAEFLSAHSDSARLLVEFFKSANEGVKRSTGNAVDLKVLLPLGLAAYSLLEIGLEASTPLWVTLGIFSFNSFVSLHSHTPVTDVKTTETIVNEREVTERPPAPVRKR